MMTAEDALSYGGKWLTNLKAIHGTPIPANSTKSN